MTKRDRPQVVWRALVSAPESYVVGMFVKQRNGDEDLARVVAAQRLADLTNPAARMACAHRVPPETS